MENKPLILLTISLIQVLFTEIKETIRKQPNIIKNVLKSPKNNMENNVLCMPITCQILVLFINHKVSLLKLSSPINQVQTLIKEFMEKDQSNVQLFLITLESVIYIKIMVKKPFNIYKKHLKSIKRSREKSRKITLQLLLILDKFIEFRKITQKHCKVTISR